MPRILVIEDDPIYREMVSEVLAEEGHELQLAENGLEGIDKARAYVPDLIISDVVMDGADGYQLLGTLRNEPSTASVPFIMMTGWSSKGGQRQSMALGADDYLAKPFNATELLDAVNAQLKKKQQSATQLSRQSTLSETSVSVLLPAELGRPLQTIHGISQVLSRPVSELTGEDIRSMGESLGMAAWRMQRAVDNFVLYNQLLSLENDPEAKAALHQDRLDRCSEYIQNRAVNMAQSRGRTQDLHLDLKDGSLAIAPEYLGRMVDELLDNAFKFSTPGTRVELILAFAPERFGMAVTDHGRGMSAAEVQRVDAFVQHGQRDADQPGLGLGLAIVRKICFLHGGGLSIKSKEGEKTRVAVELPVRV